MKYMYRRLKIWKACYSQSEIWNIKGQSVLINLKVTTFLSNGNQKCDNLEFAKRWKKKYKVKTTEASE